MVKWLAVVNWAVVAVLVLMPARTHLLSLSGLAAAGVLGLASTVAFLATGRSAFAWTSVALGCAAAILATTGARSLIDDRPELVSGTAQAVRERAAGLVGLGLPLIGSLLPLTLGMAVA